MPAGKFSEAEAEPVRARILESVARQAREHALISEALKHYQRFMDECAREPRADVAHFMGRARLAERLAKEFS